MDYGWIESTSQVAAGALIASVWQGLLLAGMIWICLKLAPKTTASVRFLVWMAVFAAGLLLTFLSVPTGSPIGAALPSSVGSSRPVLELDSRWALGIAGMWLVFSLVRALGLLRNAVRVKALWSGSVPIDVPLLEPLLSRVGFFRTARLCVSTEIDQPCVIGFFAPRILIPEWLLAKATAAELKQIVLHEVAHLRRMDDWTNLLQKLALVGFPLNPVLFWVERRLCSEREGACDESVVCVTNSPTEYAICLTNLAEERLERRMAGSAALSLGAWEKRSELAGRIHGILSGQRKLSPMKLRAVTAALVLATATGAVKLAGSAQVVQFTRHQNFRAERDRPINRDGATPMSGYQNVVFHEPSAQKKPLVRSDNAAYRRVSTPIRADFKVHASHESGLRQVSQPGARVVPVPQRGESPAETVQSFTIVTRWDSWDPSSGQHMVVTRVDEIVRGSAVAALQEQPGWYFVQL